MFGPVIVGSIFRLRPPRTEDAEVMIRWFEDPEVTARLKLRMVPSLEFEREWVQRGGEDPDSIRWTIEHEGRCVGTTAIGSINWQHRHGSTGTLIGDKSVWGRGIARELMQRRADYAFTQLPFQKLKSGYIEGNEASRRAQMAAGYREVGRLHREFYRDERWLDLVLTELQREDWERARTPAAP